MTLQRELPTGAGAVLTVPVISPHHTTLQLLQTHPHHGPHSQRVCSSLVHPHPHESATYVRHRHHLTRHALCGFVRYWPTPTLSETRAHHEPVDGARCAGCGIVSEMVRHFLLGCPQLARLPPTNLPHPLPPPSPRPQPLPTPFTQLNPPCNARRARNPDSRG
jgi:hypothetical protein